MYLIGLLWKQKLMDKTTEWTLKAIQELIELGVTVERIADRLGIDIDEVETNEQSNIVGGGIQATNN